VVGTQHPGLQHRDLVFGVVHAHEYVPKPPLLGIVLQRLGFHFGPRPARSKRPVPECLSDLGDLTLGFEAVQRRQEAPLSKQQAPATQNIGERECRRASTMA
jgi:hypothetical protein